MKLVQKAWPNGSFRVDDACMLTNIGAFNVIVVNMLFPVLLSKEIIIKILKQCFYYIKDRGVLILGVTHPCFDHYMKYGVLGRGNVETDFEGYFSSGSKFVIRDHPTAKGTFSFTDYHWTLADYFQCLQKSHFILSNIDECPPSEESKKIPCLWERKNKFPTYLVLSAQKH